MRYFFTKMEEN